MWNFRPFAVNRTDAFRLQMGPELVGDNRVLESSCPFLEQVRGSALALGTTWCNARSYPGAVCYVSRNASETSARIADSLTQL